MSEKEDKEGHPTQQLTRQRVAQSTATTGPSPIPSWPLPRPLPRREGRDYRDTPIGLLLVVYDAIRVCVGTERPLPRPLPRREERDYRDTPIGLLLVACGVSWSHVNRCSAHFITLFYMP